MSCQKIFIARQRLVRVTVKASTNPLIAKRNGELDFTNLNRGQVECQPEHHD